MIQIKEHRFRANFSIDLYCYVEVMELVKYVYNYVDQETNGQ